MNCKDCAYYWAEDFDYPCCRFVPRAPDDKPPCEYDETDYVEEENEDEN